jgi:L-lactate utilization protein LutC
METVLEKVRRALGRSQPLESVPPPPAIDEPITRLVHMDVGLPELFAKSAGELKMETEFLSVDDLLANLIAWLRSKNIQRIMLSNSTLLNRLEIQSTLRREGFDAWRWDQISLDQSYDFDCGLSDVTWAVAETGTLVIKTTPNHGRALTLVPMYHVAILEPRNFLPDSVDLFQKLATEAGSYTVMISGPSKTADIEMNVVTGVHGPNVVKAYILQ